MVEMASDKYERQLQAFLFEISLTLFFLGRFVCIVDDSKMVDGLGGSKLAMPIEIVQFCHKYTLQRLSKLPEVAGCVPKLRMEGDKIYVTDNSNYIVDLYFEVRLSHDHECMMISPSSASDPNTHCIANCSL